MESHVIHAVKGLCNRYRTHLFFCFRLAAPTILSLVVID